MNSGKTPVSGNDNLSFTVQNFDNFSYYTKEPVLVDKTYNRTVAISHFAKDLNGDGKSDLIRFESQLFKLINVARIWTQEEDSRFLNQREWILMEISNLRQNMMKIHGA